jgi:hypothetical protein
MDSNPALIIVGLIIAFFAMVAVFNAIAAKNRRGRIYAKYGRGQIADAIISKTVWVGETEQQLEDSLGRPYDTDEKVLKTKRKVIWKYQHRGGNRFGLRITVENGLVVGWDEKL